MIRAVVREVGIITFDLLKIFKQRIFSVFSLHSACLTMKDVKELGRCELDGNLWARIVRVFYLQHFTAVYINKTNLGKITRMCTQMW